MPFPESPACSSCVATGCTFQYGSIDLYYYPVTKNVSRDMCTDEPAGGWENSATITADPDSTYTEVTTGSYTVVNGVTMYEGNIYISLADPYVLDSCRNSVAPKFNKPRIITMASSDLYSVRGYPHNIIPYSIQWADFQDPVPWSAYVGQSYCANNRVACTEVIPGSYLPAMSMPGQIRQLDPNWASCDFDKYGLFDPPIALHGVPNFLTSTSATADPTPTSAESVISATPGQSSNGDMPTATSKPQLTESSTDLEDPASSTTPEDPAPSSSQTPTDPQGPAPSNTEGPSPQDPTPSGPQTLSQSQNPAPSSTQVPAEPQVSDPSTQQDPSPSDSQDTTPSESLDPAPSATRDPSPNGPQEPSPSASAINDPQNSIPSSTQGSSTNVPQDTVISQNPPTDPNANPTGTAKNGPSNPTPPAITIGPTVFPINPTGGVVVETGTALSSGGASVVISSSTFNIGSGGLTIVSPETSAEIPFGTEPVTVPIGPNSAPVVLDPAASTIIIGGTTLAPGGAPITVDDTILSVGSSGVVVAGPSGTSTIANPTADGTPAAVTVGSDAFPITSGSIVLGPGTILGPGDPAVTISDTVFSVDSTGLVVIGNGKTSILPVTLDASSRAGATSEGSTGSSTATGAGSSPSQTGDVEFSGVAANIGWSKTLIVALLGAIYVII
ncbi:hypothetical protein SLS60_000624 [Paraconiothyrium brasiliense]|uniref:Uncharacterized protein n=1 Tax=Paraconiothyrium brasiliense TaxID=300254 RepID=A0ABR3S6S9_9PLEO